MTMQPYFGPHMGLMSWKPYSLAPHSIVRAHLRQAILPKFQISVSFLWENSPIHHNDEMTGGAKASPDAPHLHDVLSEDESSRRMTFFHFFLAGLHGTFWDKLPSKSLVVFSSYPHCNSYELPSTFLPFTQPSSQKKKQASKQNPPKNEHICVKHCKRTKVAKIWLDVVPFG